MFRNLKKSVAAVFTIFLILLLSMAAYAANLEVHNIDVGQADAALVICDGHNMLIDGGDPSDSNLIYTYLKQHGVTSLDYIVCTHADEDHVGGIPGAIQLVGSNIGTAFAPYKENSKERFIVFKEQLAKYRKDITIPAVDGKYTLGGASFEVLSLGKGGNDESIVLRIENGAHSFLFMGDATGDVEDGILKSGHPLASTMLKVAHHGSATSTSAEFLKAVKPQYAVISVGKDNQYGHPKEEVLTRLKNQGVEVLRTDLNGDIVFHSDGTTLTVTTEKSSSQLLNLTSDNQASKESSGTRSAVTAAAAAVSKDSGARAYVLNTNTKKFHYPTCKSADTIKPKNRKDVTDTRENIISQGYVPCKNCNP